MKMDTLLKACLTEDWENATPKKLEAEVIREFKDRYPKLARVMNRQNKIKNPRRKPQWSKATLQKRRDYSDANKEKIGKREAQNALYKRSKRLQRKKSKRAFNREMPDMVQEKQKDQNMMKSLYEAGKKQNEIHI